MLFGCVFGGLCVWLVGFFWLFLSLFVWFISQSHKFLWRSGFVLQIRVTWRTQAAKALEAPARDTAKFLFPARNFLSICCILFNLISGCGKS
jgi:hypothetical protein